MIGINGDERDQRLYRPSTPVRAFGEAVFIVKLTGTADLSISHCFSRDDDCMHITCRVIKSYSSNPETLFQLHC